MPNPLAMLAQASGQAPPPPGGQSQDGARGMTQLVVWILLMGAAMYFLMIRPQSKQRKEHQKMLTEVRSGDKIVTSGGIHGVISNVKEKTFTVRVSQGVTLEIDKGSIARVVEKAEAGGEAKSK